MGSWKTQSSKVVYENPWLFVHEDQVTFPNGKAGIYGVIESKSDAVFVVPIDEDGNVYIIQQEHYTTRELVWQCVAGRTDGEAPEVAAKRELQEEAGLDANEIILLSKSSTASGMTTFHTSICLARELTANRDNIDEDEDINAVKKFPISAIKAMILDGTIANTETIAALLLAFTYTEEERKV